RHVFTDRVVYLWDPATGKDLVHLRRHNDRVTSARFSPDGKKVVTASWDQTARIWDAATGKELQVLRGHERSILAALFSPDGRRVLTVSTSRQEGSSDDPQRAAAPGEVDPGPQTRAGRFGESGSAQCNFHLFGEARLACLWDADSGKQLAVLTKKAPEAFVFGHVWNPSAP